MSEQRLEGFARLNGVLDVVGQLLELLLLFFVFALFPKRTILLSQSSDLSLDFPDVVGGTTKLLSLPLFLDKELSRSSKTVHELDDLPVEVTLREGSTPDNIKGQIFGWEFHLRFSQDNLVVLTIFFEDLFVSIDCNDSLSTTNPDLKC